MSCTSRADRVKSLKGLRKHFIRIALKQDLILIESKNWNKFLFQDPITKRLIKLRQVEYAMANDEFARAALTILWKSRDIVLKPTIDVTNIWRQCDASSLVLSMRKEEISERWRSFGIGRNELFYLSLNPKWRWSNKSGPFGPCMASISTEMKAYGKEDVRLLNEYIRCSDAPPYSPVVRQIRRLSPISNPRPVRRLSALADYEGKTRVIAIGDYLSNCLLKPLHDELMNCLKGISSDYTHKQYTLHTVYVDDMKPVSVDLTAATDRIPVEITSHILGEYFADHNLGQAWQALMVNFQFTYKDVTQKGNVSTKRISYRCGQPMGLYSSWPAMALTNHVLVRFAAAQLGYKEYDRYMIIGDDVVIFDHWVAYNYINIIDSLGIEINRDDSIWPKTEKPYEIAKRLFRNGNEVSPVPYNLYDTNISLYYWVYSSRYLVGNVLQPKVKPKPYLASLLMWYYTSVEDWQVPVDYDHTTSVQLPRWALFSKELGNFTSELTKFESDDDIRYWILITYFNEIIRNEVQEYSILTSNDIVSKQALVKNILGFGYTPEQHIQVKDIRSESMQELYTEILRSQMYMKTGGPGGAGSEREPGGHPFDQFRFIRYYKGFKSHFKDVFDKVIISKKSLTSNPWRQLEFEWIIKWERQVESLSDSQVQAVTEFVLSHREQSETTLRKEGS
jgi:hypothetical protein